MYQLTSWSTVSRHNRRYIVVTISSVGQVSVESWSLYRSSDILLSVEYWSKIG